MSDLKIIKPATPQLEVTFKPVVLKIDLKSGRAASEMESSADGVDFETEVGKPVITFSAKDVQIIADMFKQELRKVYPDLTI